MRILSVVVVHHVNHYKVGIKKINDCERFDSEDDLTSQVVKMSVTVSNSPVQDYFHLDDYTHSNKLLFFKRGGNKSTCRKTS